jgi:hypothetical protein
MCALPSPASGGIRKTELITESIRRRLGRSVATPAAALAVAVVAFLLYRATLLPGFDFGDTASFQVVAGSAIISPRDGYPLYFAIGALALRFLGGDPAHALNLVSAIVSALAAGALSLAATEISGSAAAGAASGLLFAGSYTFWSQSVIAEVYGLHALFVATTFWWLLQWEKRPSLARLVVFFSVYALGFGNHLSMILLAPAYALFLLTTAPAGWRSMIRPRVVALAGLVAVIGSLQYAWNLRTLWYAGHPPAGLLDAIKAGWFDITKSDWRESMVMNVPRAMLSDHAAMYAFDLRQQFGIPGIALSATGFLTLIAWSWRRALLIFGVYFANALFAYSYNVGDTHVFYLPSHLAVALMTAPALVLIGRLAGRAVGSSIRNRTALTSRSGFTDALAVTCVALLAIVYAGTRIYRDYPALDRSDDRRPAEWLDTLTAGLDDRRAILLTNLNWQSQNGLTYYGLRLHPELAYARMPEVLLYAPALIADNFQIGRDVILTARARADLVSAYGPLIPTRQDSDGTPAGIGDIAAGLAEGTRYTLCLLKPTRDFALDEGELGNAAARLTAGTLTALPKGDYVAIAGRVGHAAALIAAADRPFRRTVDLDGTRVEIRMESWLAADTIRRMGFGHVIASRRHTLIVERGVSFAAFDTSGAPVRSGYSAGLFAPQKRYVCYR